VKIKIGSGLMEVDGVPQVHLFVEDDGVGMDAETKARMFEPYFSTKPLEKGTGLGLSIVYGIVQQNEGQVEVVTSLEEGTSMRLFFAATDEPAAIPPVEESRQLQAANQKRILLVEDEDVVRGLASSTLQFAGYSITEASNGVEAVKLFEARPGEFDMVVTDVVMPQMGGRELVQAITKLQPEMKVLYLSGHIADEELQAEITKNGVPFLPKPFKPSELITRVFEVISES
jgi:CheY-like chemotaxis protein